MVDDEDLRRMSPQQRLRLRQMLAELDVLDPSARRVSQRRRTILLAVVIVRRSLLPPGSECSPRRRRGTTGPDWRGAWVGFDIALLVTFAATGWAAWRRRQILIIRLVVLATLLCCDAWFDVVLDARTSGFEVSLLSANPH